MEAIGEVVEEEVVGGMTVEMCSLKNLNQRCLLSSCLAPSAAKFSSCTSTSSEGI